MKNIITPIELLDWLSECPYSWIRETNKNKNLFTYTFYKPDYSIKFIKFSDNKVPMLPNYMPTILDLEDGTYE